MIKKNLMTPLALFINLFLILGQAHAADDWVEIGTSEAGYKVFATKADVLSDGVLRMFLKAEKEVEIQPKGMFAIFKKPEKFIDKVPAFSLLLHCKKKAVRDNVPGPLGSEFHVPWTQVPPGSFGSIALTAFCRK